MVNCRGRHRRQRGEDCVSKDPHCSVRKNRRSSSGGISGGKTPEVSFAGEEF